MPVTMHGKLSTLAPVVGSAGGAAQHGLPAHMPSAAVLMHSDEAFLQDMLTQMDVHMQLLRAAQQAVVAALEGEFRQALGHQFGRMVLVGSGALGAETPGSDLDVVCFTRDRGTQAPFGVEVLTRVHDAFAQLGLKFPDATRSLATELIVDARVPILRVLLGSVAVDASINQDRPLAHVNWLQRVGAAPHPASPSPRVAPLVTVVLRSLKWWLKQRQIPRAKEGCLPTLAWLFMAVHSAHTGSSRNADRMLTLAHCQGRPMAAILGSLAVFFRAFSHVGGLDGTLVFGNEATSSNFVSRQRDHRKQWPEFALPDPTCAGSENLAPVLTPATHLLLAYELRRAAALLSYVREDGHTSPLSASGEGQRQVAEVFEPIMEGINSLPAYVGTTIGVLLLLGGTVDKTGAQEGIGTLEVALLDRTEPKRGWAADFLHRSDTRSELHVRLLEVEEKTGRLHLRKRGAAVFCPCHFVCRMEVLGESGPGRKLSLAPEGFRRLKGMREYMHELSADRRPLRDTQREQQRQTQREGDQVSAEPCAAKALRALASPALSVVAGC